MKKSAFLWGAVILLLLLNLGTLFFVLISRQQTPPPPEHGRAGFDDMVIRTLQLSPEQVDRFEKLKHQHHEAMMQLDDNTAMPFRQYFGLLQQPAPNSLLKDSLEQAILLLYRNKLRLTYDHFQQLKAICTPEQQSRFDQLIPFLMQVMTPERKNPGPGRRRTE